MINLQSGFPLNVQQAADARLSVGGTTTANRPNLVGGADLATDGSYRDRLASADHATATWINPAAFSLAAAGTFGDTPRTITDLRTPGQYNVDAVVMKNVSLRRLEGGADQGRSAEHAQPPDRPRAAGREHRRQLELRPDDDPGRLHADYAGDGEVLVLIQAGDSADEDLHKDQEGRRSGGANFIF